MASCKLLLPQFLQRLCFLKVFISYQISGHKKYNKKKSHEAICFEDSVDTLESCMKALATSVFQSDPSSLSVPLERSHESKLVDTPWSQDQEGKAIA